MCECGGIGRRAGLKIPFRFRSVSSILTIRTTVNTSQTPNLSNIQLLSETLGKLKQTEKLLKNLSLYNKKHLLNRNGIYYFVTRLSESIILKKSLHTSNLIYAIVLKLKILHKLGKFNMASNDFKQYQSIKTKNSITLIAENEQEEKLLAEIEKTAIAKIKRLKRNHSVNIETNEIRDNNTLKKLTDEYLKYKEKLVKDKKHFNRFEQAVEFLHIYFGEKKLIKDITQKDNIGFQDFLLSIPSNWKKKKELVDKDLKQIYDKSPKMFEQYEKLGVNTVNEKLKTVISIFEYFLENSYIYNNPFKKVKNGIKRELTEKREFHDNELKKIFFYLQNKDLMEEYRYLKFLHYCGWRREEGLIITKKDIEFDKSLINVFGKKTTNSKRISIIHKDLIEDLNIQLNGKNDDDYLFFNLLDLTPRYRSDKVGNKLNAYIKDIVGKEIKKEIDLHSFRKNFAQIISLSGLFSDLELKTLIGHSTRGDVTDTHYIRGKRNWETLKERMDKVDFSEFF